MQRSFCTKILSAMKSSKNLAFIKIQSHVLLCSWKNAEVVIHVRGHDDSYSPPQVLKTQYPVVAVLNLRSTVISIDSKGHVYRVVHDESMEDETNLEVHDDSAMSPSSPVLGSGKLKNEPNKVKFQLAELGSLSGCEEVFYASFIPETEQLIVISKMNNRLFLVAYNSSSLQVIFITKIPYNITEIKPEKSHIKVCHSKLMDAQLKNVLFPVMEAPAFSEFTVLIAALSNGSVLWITSNNSCNGLQFLHKCYQSISAISFFSLGGSKTFNSLCLTLEEGPVLLLSSVNKKLSINTLFLPTAAKAVYCKSNGSILSSDYNNCFYTSFYMVEKKVDFKTCSVSVKGVVKFLPSVDEENTVIATTNLNFAYKICIGSIEPSKISERFSMPKKGVLNECIATSNALDGLLKQIKEEDEKIAAISLTMRAPILQEYFNTSVKIYSGPAAVKFGSTTASSDSHAFVIRIENKCNFYEFSPKLWFINVILSLNSDMSKSIHRNVSLKQPLKFNNKIIFSFPVRFKADLMEPILKVRLVSKQSNSSVSCPWLVIPLKNISVNPVYFFTPLKNPISSNFDATSSNFEKYLKKLTKSEESSISESSHLTYFIRLPERIRELQNVFGLLLNYARYRCKENVWNSITDNSKSICFATVFDKLTQFSLEKDCLRLQISYVDAPFFHAVKLAIINLFSSLFADEFIVLKRSLLISVQGSLQALEISQVSGNSDFQGFQCLLKELRSTIDVNLPP